MNRPASSHEHGLQTVYSRDDLSGTRNSGRLSRIWRKSVIVTTCPRRPQSGSLGERAGVANRKEVEDALGIPQVAIMGRKEELERWIRPIPSQGTTKP